MKKNKTWFVFSVMENGDFRASTLSVSAGENLWAVLKTIPNLQTVNVCVNKAGAEQIAAAWNADWTRDGKILAA